MLHDGDIVLETAHGHADVEAGTVLTTDHLFRIASHSKTFTATAIMQLAERGRLRLDDTVGRWLPARGGAPIAASRCASCSPMAAGWSATAATATTGSSCGPSPTPPR